MIKPWKEPLNLFNNKIKIIFILFSLFHSTEYVSHSRDEMSSLLYNNFSGSFQKLYQLFYV